MPTDADPPGEGEVVLVIDDEPTIRMLIAEVLAESGYAVIEAPDGPAGLKVLNSNARIDLLITDVGLPGGMNGRQVADAARVSRPEPEGAVHHRLRRKRGHRSEPPQERHVRHDEAISRWNT